MYIASQGDDKIVRFAMDAATGDLEPQGEVMVPGGPAPIAVDPRRQWLYVARRGECKISAYRIDQHTGGLGLLGAVELPTDPCYLSTDRRGKFLLAAYYEGRGVSIHAIGDDGAVVDPPIERRETARGAHSIQTDPSNRFAFVPHIAGRGPNELWQFHFDEATGHLTPNSPPKVIPQQPLGPRHFCFHPSKDLLYCSNEQGCSVTAYRLDTSAGTLTALQTVSTLPDGYTGQNSCSQIQIDPSGKFLYAPNRGHNSIAGFVVDAHTGLLTSIGQTASEPVPRAFSLDPEGKFLYAAGLESGRLAAYRIDPRTGRLQPLRTYAIGARPMWVMIIKLPG
jgi:6-phosphogluconolactonase (cycloisomerase 2 family)